MPIYEYRCTQCDHVFERFQPVGGDAPACPQCGSPSRKVFTSVGLIFKGSGFHTTDYRKTSGNGDQAPADSSAETKTKSSAPSTSSSGTSSDK